VVALSYSPAWAYEGDHYALTFYLAMQVGFTRRQAYQIASGAYALDWDPNTSPMEASPPDAIFGVFAGFGARAGEPGIIPTTNPRIANIWKNFHAFADANVIGLVPDTVSYPLMDPLKYAIQRNAIIGCSLTTVEEANAQSVFVATVKTQEIPVCSDEVKAKVAAIRLARQEQLWKLAKRDGNPGPLIHYVQDLQSHFMFNNVRGHAFAGHAPDFLSFNVDRATAATYATLGRLLDFRDWLGTFYSLDPRVAPVAGSSGYLQQERLIPSKQGIEATLAALIQCNPKPDLLDMGLFDPSGPDRTIPDLGKSIDQVDIALGTPYWPFELKESDYKVPREWYPYTYTPGGKINEADAGAVEKIALRFDAPTIESVEKLNVQGDSDSEERYHVILRLKYHISGIASVRTYLYPLPAVETHQFTGQPLKSFTIEVPKGDNLTPTPRMRHNATGGAIFPNGWTGYVGPFDTSRRRENGDFDVGDVVIELSKDDYEAGRLSWQPSVQLYGYKPVAAPPLVVGPHQAKPCGDLTGTRWRSNLDTQTDPWIFCQGVPQQQVSMFWPLDPDISQGARAHGVEDPYLLQGSYDGTNLKLTRHKIDYGSPKGRQMMGTEEYDLEMDSECKSIIGKQWTIPASGGTGKSERDFVLRREPGNPVSTTPCGR
jgi:hypothetical protein